MKRLDGKRALITGGTSGIGLETARLFLKEGARVAITGRDPASLAAAREEFGESLAVIAADSADLQATERLVSEIGERFGGLDVLFVNAGVAEFRPLDQWDEAAFDRSIAINLKGPFFLIRALLPYFADPASIILNTSINAHIGMPSSSVYAATKAGLLSLARTLSGELIGRGIRVNAISPGPIGTPLYGKLGLSPTETEGLREQIVRQVPAGRFGRPEEVASAALFLAADEQRFMVGSELIIDGGMSTL